MARLVVTVRTYAVGHHSSISTINLLLRCVGRQINLRRAKHGIAHQINTDGALDRDGVSPGPSAGADGVYLHQEAVRTHPLHHRRRQGMDAISAAAAAAACSWHWALFFPSIPLWYMWPSAPLSAIVRFPAVIPPCFPPKPCSLVPDDGLMHVLSRHEIRN